MRRLFQCVLIIVSVGVAAATYMLLAPYSASSIPAERLPDRPSIRSEGPATVGRFPDKVWAHRVDSVEHAVLVAKEYKGLEIDVVYDSAAHYFDVGHPPEPSAGVSLEHVLLAIPDVSSHYFWLDFKNLTEENSRESCAVLVSLAGRFRITKNTIVESPNPRALACFAESGFYTSYYLFAEFDADDVRHMSVNQVTHYYEEVRADLLASGVNAVSADYRYLPFIEKYVSGRDILLWYIDEKKTLSYCVYLLRLRLNARIKVILVSQPGPDYR